MTMRRLKLVLKRCKEILKGPPPGLDESHANVRYLEAEMTAEEWREYVREQVYKQSLDEDFSKKATNE